MGKTHWGSIEIALSPLSKSNSFLGVSFLVIGFMAFIFVAGLAGNFFVLRRTLKALDPASVVPDRVQKAFNTLAEGVVVIDNNGLILLANSTISEDLGVDTTVLLGHKIDHLPWVSQIAGKQEFPWMKTIEGSGAIVESRLSMRSHSGETINYSTNSAQITDPNDKIVGAIVTFDNVTDLEYKNAELNKMVDQLQKKDTEIRLKNRELHILATKDPLTNCLNRRAFFDGFNEGLKDIPTNNTSVCCMMIDLDKFKQVNDTYGHSVGDQVIVLMGNILKSAVGIGDVAGRYGGEEFCIVRFGYSQEDNLAIAEKIRTSIIEYSKQIPTLREPITTSIGIATMVGAEVSPTALIDRADKALYTAKTEGRDQIVQWDIYSKATPEINNIYGLKHSAPGQLEKTPEELQEGLRNALQNDDLCLYFQPIIDLDDCKVRSMEVLVRFENEELRGCSVEKLIAIAEQSGQIIEIGYWVMDTAISQYQHWTNTLGEQPMMAVNYSAFQIADRKASTQIVDLIKEKMTDPSKLEIEITESAIIKDISGAKIVLQQLRDLGVRIVLDDFGTGYSSLKYISEFKPDGIKMDQYFLKHIDRDSSDQRLVAAIITMAKNLHIDIVAEGIETTAQLKNIMSLKCDYGQGYLFSKPMPANIMPEWLALFSKKEQIPTELRSINSAD